MIVIENIIYAHLFFPKSNGLLRANLLISKSQKKVKVKE